MKRLPNILPMLISLLIPTLQASADALRPVTAWDESRAAHLLRRAGFGGTPEEIRHFVEIGAKAAVESLIDFEKIPQTHPPYERLEVPEEKALRGRMESAMASGADREAMSMRFQQVYRQMHQLQMLDLRAWWMQRMVLSPRPLEEKMTLFWHGHFTSGFREVRESAWMVRQHEFLRDHALGNFRDLLLGISRDPAMLRYLDNASNSKEKPNENYARELLELFALGEGHYTEMDVKEAARAFTGWGLKDGRFQYNPRRHDFGKKKFLGEEGDFDGEDIIDILLRRNATSRHLATALLEFFVMENPRQTLVDSMEVKLRQTRFDLRETLRALFMSEAFYDERTRFNLVKSPVELVVGTLRLLEIEPKDIHALGLAADHMGQALFQPPNVKGWDGGLQWINTATLFNRYSFVARYLAGTTGGDPSMKHEMEVTQMSGAVGALMHDLDVEGARRLPKRSVASASQPAFDPTGLYSASALKTPDEAVDHFVRRLLQQDVSDEFKNDLREIFLDKMGRPELDASRITSLVVALLCTPEYQVN